MDRELMPICVMMICVTTVIGMVWPQATIGMILAHLLEVRKLELREQYRRGESHGDEITDD